MTAPTEDSAAPVRRLSRRMLAVIGAVVAVIAVAVVLILGAVLSRPATTPLGSAATADLLPGSCLAEASTTLTSYTVVSCSDAPALQVVAELDLSSNTADYTSQSSLTTFADAVCDRYLEFGLFVKPGVDPTNHDALAIAVPSPEAVAAGDTRALCAVRALDGPLAGDVYRPMP